MKTLSNRMGIALALVSLVAACKPSPDQISLSSKTVALQPGSTSTTARLVEGDVLVVEAIPKDGAESMNLCVDASSSEANVVSLRKVTDKCRFFVLAASQPGSALVRFQAREQTADLIVDVTPLR